MVLLRHVPRRYELQNPPQPNLYRDMFPYTDIPRIQFDGLIVPTNLPETIFITDTTFRDGQQARPPYEPQTIARIYDMLHRLGGPRGVIRQCEFFLYSDRDRKAVDLCKERGYQYPEITGWIRAVEKDFALVKAMELRETGILTSASDYHIYRKLNIDRKQALEAYLRVVKAALEAGIVPRCHLEDVTRAAFYGFVVPFAQALMDLASESGIPIKLRLCDTLGFGVPFREAALPRSVPKLVYGLIHEAGFPSERLEWHGHNDFHKGQVNGTAAWLYGCAAVNATCLGFGERTGNPPLEAAVMDYIALRGTADGMDPRVITEIAQFFQQECGIRVPPWQPLVGAQFNSTSAGIHADGMEKFQEIYNPFDTERLLNRPVGITINDKSGAAGVALWIRLNRGLEIDKHHPRLKPILMEIQNQFDAGRLTALGDDEMHKLVDEHFPELVESDLDRLKERARELAGAIVETYREDNDLRSMDGPRMERVLQQIVDAHPFVQYAYVCNRVGRKVTRNVVQPRDTEKYQGWSVEDFSDREWFKAPLEDGAVHVTGLYTSRLTGRLCFTVSTTLTVSGDHNELAGVLGLDVSFEDLLRWPAARTHAG